ncbi:MAG: hypothetical protein IH594_06205 [Bacteroidales bacterium]|nr:hypothetical protein [Bacteroidales bacterium]
MKQLFRKIRSIDWRTYPIEAINDMFIEFEEVPYMVTDYHDGKIIHRVRPLKVNEVVNTVDGLKYKPQDANTTYQRASTPRQTMFYGSVISEDEDSETLSSPRNTSAMESCHLLRNPKLDGKQKLLYGKWKVNSTISLITVLFTKYRNAKNVWIKNLSEAFYQNICGYNYEQQKKFRRVNNFISDEYSKFVGEEEDYKYLVSSLFNEGVIENGFDGVLYPSVRTMRRGMNVAIIPSNVEDKMDLISVLECEVHKRGKKVILNNLRYCDVPEGSIGFELQDIVDPELRFSDIQIENFLNS